MFIFTLVLPIFSLQFNTDFFIFSYGSTFTLRKKRFAFKTFFSSFSQFLQKKKLFLRCFPEMKKTNSKLQFHWARVGGTLLDFLRHDKNIFIASLVVHLAQLQISKNLLFLLHEQLRTMISLDALLWLLLRLCLRNLSITQISFSAFFFPSFFFLMTWKKHFCFLVIFTTSLRCTLSRRRFMPTEWIILLFAEKRFFIHPKVGNFNIIKITGRCNKNTFSFLLFSVF